MPDGSRGRLHSLPMTTVTLEDAQSRFSEIARAVESGETVIVTRDGEPILDLVPHPKPAPVKTGGIDWEGGRRFLEERGIKGLFTCVAEDFDDPLPEDFLLRPLP